MTRDELITIRKASTPSPRPQVAMDRALRYIDGGRVSAALADGWTLYGPPTYAYDAARGGMRCGQAVTKDVDAAYDPAMKLGQQ
jgi:hypothetical protein